VCPGRFCGFSTTYSRQCPGSYRGRCPGAHHAGVRRSLNSHCYDSSSASANSFLIGSWGKYTKTRPPRDIDLYFVLPYEIYQRFESVQGNKQSALLQEDRRVLQGTYPNTNLRGDGQVARQARLRPDGARTDSKIRKQFQTVRALCRRVRAGRGHSRSGLIRPNRPLPDYLR
jgi:hypothetical protein